MDEPIRTGGNRAIVPGAWDGRYCDVVDNDGNYFRTRDPEVPEAPRSGG